ncbi:MAG: hypothetical protein MI923_29310 [Phycisphaerales bacterium]|nr:hypothetical protein [Phycisphaerales bacterium]
MTRINEYGDNAQRMNTTWATENSLMDASIRKPIVVTAETERATPETT